MKRLLLALVVLLPGALALRAQDDAVTTAPAKKKAGRKAPRRQRPSRNAVPAETGPKTLPTVKVPSPSAAPHPPAAPPQPLAEPSAVEALSALGVSVREAEGSAEVDSVLPGSLAAQMGLLPQDRLAVFNGHPVKSQEDVARAWLDWDPALRQWAAARRGLHAVQLQEELPPEEPAFVRGPKELSAHEAILKAGLLERASQAAQAQVAQAPGLQVSVPARQVLWIRFPEGLPQAVAAGDLVAGEVTMAVASDANLDFLCLPPATKVWGKVLQVSAADGTKALRLHFYKAALAGGHVIPISARLTDAAGEQPLLKVSSGGTLVLGEPVIADPKKARKAPLLDPDVRLRLELLEAATVSEPPQFYPSGPGLWIKTKETPAGRVFEVTHVIAGRSAEKAGVRVGDVLTAIAGRSTAKMDFGEALAALYGSPGSRFKVTVLKPGAEGPSTMELKRGIFYRDGVETPAPLPFVKKEKPTSKAS